MMQFVKWEEKLPKNFGELDCNEQFDVIDELTEQVGYLSYFKYPFEQDIKENKLPKVLLEHLVQYIDTAILVFENYVEDDVCELMIIALNQCDIDSQSGDLLEAIAYNPHFNEKVAEELISWYEEWGIELYGDAFSSICKTELPQNLVRYYFEKAKEIGSCWISDLAECPTLPEDIIREMFDIFNKLDDNDFDELEEKGWICDSLLENDNTPEDIRSVMLAWNAKFE